MWLLNVKRMYKFFIIISFMICKVHCSITFNPTIEVCKFQNNQLYCKYVRDTIPGQFLPPKSCHIFSCENCIKQWIPYFCVNPYQCYPIRGQNILNQNIQFNNEGKYHVFQCEQQCNEKVIPNCKPQECDCDKNKCNGDFIYCNITKVCEPQATCNCRTVNTDVSLQLQTIDETLDCYAIISYLVCHFETHILIPFQSLKNITENLEQNIYDVIK